MSKNTFSLVNNKVTRGFWLDTRRWCFVKVLALARKTLELSRPVWPAVFRFQGVFVINDRKLLSDEFFSAMLTGRYERFEIQCMNELSETTEPLIELGGSLGIMTCVLAQRLPNCRARVVVEANPSLIPLLRRNLSANKKHDAIVVNAAVTTRIQEKSGCKLSFSVDSPSLDGAIRNDGGAGCVEVDPVSLESLYDEHVGSGGYVLFCDIEGQELALLGCLETVRVLRRASQAIVECHEVHASDGMRWGPHEIARLFSEKSEMKSIARYGNVWLFGREC